jgi:hypothetical protein
VPAEERQHTPRDGIENDPLSTDRVTITLSLVIRCHRYTWPASIQSLVVRANLTGGRRSRLLSKRMYHRSVQAGVAEMLSPYSTKYPSRPQSPLPAPPTPESFQEKLCLACRYSNQIFNVVRQDFIRVAG